MRRILTMAMLLGAYLPAAHADEYDGYGDYAIEPSNIAAMPRVPSPATVSDFYQPLSAYGTWINDAAYGYVFVPYDASFQPYSDGYWAQSGGGYVWMSSSPMGWAVEHYGRWAWRDRWVWIPDTSYSAGWVDWRTGDDGCVGWAPLGPSGYSIRPEHYRYVDRGYVSSPEMPRHYRGNGGTVVVPSHLAQSAPGWGGERPERYTPPAPRYTPPAPRYTPPARVVEATPRYTPPAPRYTPPARVVQAPPREIPSGRGGFGNNGGGGFEKHYGSPRRHGR